MLYKKAAKIAEEVSAIGVGCWNFGGDWDCSNDNNSISIVHAAIDNGINLFDVAPVYGWYHAERVLGKALKGERRKKVLIASKCGLVWNDKHEAHNDLSKANILREIDESLERLQTDYIDLYQLHWPDPGTSIEETASALDLIQKQGKIRYVGLSNFAQADVETFMTYIDIHAQQGLYNMLERNTTSYHSIPLAYKTEKEMLQTVKKHGQAFLPYSPLFQGLLAGELTLGKDYSDRDIRNQNPKLSGELFKKYYEGYTALKQIADDMGKPINEMAINWLRQKPEVTCIIGGLSSPQQIEKNLKALEWDIPNDVMERIQKVLAPFENI